MPPSEWPEETVGLEKCGLYFEHGIYRGILIHEWGVIGWCITAVDGGVEGLNVNYGQDADHRDCSTEEQHKVTCLFGTAPPFAAINAAWDSPKDNVAYKVTEIPR